MMIYPLKHNIKLIIIIILVTSFAYHFRSKKKRIVNIDDSKEKINKLHYKLLLDRWIWT